MEAWTRGGNHERVRREVEAEFNGRGGSGGDPGHAHDLGEGREFAFCFTRHGSDLTGVELPM